jgi:DNA-binding transcriptional ArsR family regulator
VAALIGDEARAAMLLALASGESLSASALADHARIGPSTASAHLARLVGGGLLTVERRGRSRYYRLAGHEVAVMIEALVVLAPLRPTRTLDESSRLAALRAGRTCYDHLAGRLGVALFRALVARGALLDVALVDVGGRKGRSGLGPVFLGPRAQPSLPRSGWSWARRRRRSYTARPASTGPRRSRT